MSSVSNTSRLLMIVVAIAIAIFYIRPTIVAIGVTQDEIQTYQTEITKISEVNAQLAALVAQVNSVSTQNQTALVRYLPDQIDPLAVLKDLQIMLELNQIINPTVEYEGMSTSAAIDQDTPLSEAIVPHTFTVSAQMAYAQLKNYLRTVEQNNYLLEVAELTIEPADGALLEVAVTFVVYERLLN